METSPQLYDSVLRLLLQMGRWRDVRHAQTLGWMVVGLVMTAQIQPSAWADYLVGRAQQAASRVRRLIRWLKHERIEVGTRYTPLIRAALAEWGAQRLYVALDTSLLRNRFCMIRLGVVYRGRAVPLVWQVLEHPSSSVAWESLHPLLAQAAALLPPEAEVSLLADRGFVDTQLMRYISEELRWHWRIRLKGNFWLSWRGRRRCKAGRLSVASGRACFLHHLTVTAQSYGPVHLALGRALGSQERWLVLSDQPTTEATFAEYGLRFDIEENFLDDKSNGFQLASGSVPRRA